jgi:MFS family permease
MNLHSTPNTADIHSLTYRYDLWRGAFRGVLSTGATTFGLFIAIRYFHSGDTLKSVIAGAPFLGMFLSVPLVHYLSLTGLRKSLCAALPVCVTGLCLLAAGGATTAIPFALLILAAYICLNAMTPFLTSIYTDNYPQHNRGSAYSRPMTVTVVATVVFGFLASYLLDADLKYYPAIFIVLGLCALGKAWAVNSMPSQTVEPGGTGNPFGNFRYAVQDRFFGYILFTWFIMGFANLWTLPLRVDYVTSARYGIEGSALLVSLLTAIIPDLVRIVFIPIWGRLFDRMNFIVLRIILNAIFGLGIILFFLTPRIEIIALGSVLIGIANAGGNIAWALWVTKFAPPGKAAAYMSVHVSLTGIRGAIGPWVGFWAVSQIGPSHMGMLSGAMMFFASLLLISEIGFHRSARGH